MQCGRSCRKSTLARVLGPCAPGLDADHPKVGVQLTEALLTGSGAREYLTDAAHAMRVPIPRFDKGARRIREARSESVVAKHARASVGERIRRVGDHQVDFVCRSDALGADRRP